VTLRTVLIVSPHFPPSTLAGVHRARHLAKHLPAHGWRPVVISAAPEHYTESGDPALADLVPPDLAQVRTTAMPASLCRLAGIGDIGLRAYPFLARAIDAAVAAERPQAVFVTGAPFYPLLLGRAAKRRHGLPVVLDFQDPWVSAHGATRPAWSKAGLAHRLAVALEPAAVRAADWITAVSDAQNSEMAARYPWLDAGRMSAAPIGGDPEDFETLRRRPPPAKTLALDPTLLNFSYVGTVLPRAGPLVRTLMRALAGLRADRPALAERIRFQFLGSSNQPDGRDAYRVRPIAEAEGVGDLVNETPQRAPYLEALSVLASSHALLLIGSDEPHYTASKIYPALMSGRPFLSLFHRASSAHAILSAAGGGRAMAFETETQLEALQGPLAEALGELAATPERFGRPDPSAYAPYTAHAVAAQFARVFDQVANA
jgi:hypothetical protein